MVESIKNAAESALAGGESVVCFDFGNQKYWAKRFTGSKAKYLNEIKCLRAFFHEGAPVPPLVFESDAFFVTTDYGVALESCIRASDDATPLLETAMIAVAEMHKKGLAHGGLHMRNMTLDAAKKIGFLDLEKGSVRPATMEAQAYDLVVFVWSTISIDLSASGSLLAAKNAYVQAHGPAWGAAEKWCHQRRWMRTASKPLQWHEAKYKANSKYKRYAAVPLVLDFFEL